VRSKASVLVSLTDPGIRLDVGGKLLTNQLKELVSFRQWNMMDETYIMNHVKESCCYVSADFKKDLELCRCVAEGLTENHAA
jgi:actin-related protein